MDVRTLAARLGVSARATSRAEELMRLADAKMGTAGAAALARPAVCLDLACSEMRTPVDREALIRMSGATSKVFLAQLGALGGALGARQRVDARALGVRFGALRCVPAAEHCLALFKARFVAPLGRARAASADFGRPVFGAAAFFLAARAAGVRVPRQQLCSAAGVAPAELSATLAQMQSLCADLFSQEGSDSEGDADAGGPPGAGGAKRGGKEAGAKAGARPQQPPAPPPASPRRKVAAAAAKSPPPVASPRRREAAAAAAAAAATAAAAAAADAPAEAPQHTPGEKPRGTAATPASSARRTRAAAAADAATATATASGGGAKAARGGASAALGSPPPPRSAAKRARLSFEQADGGAGGAGGSAAKAARRASRG